MILCIKDPPSKFHHTALRANKPNQQNGRIQKSNSIINSVPVQQYKHIEKENDLGMSLTKEIEDFYDKNYQTLKRLKRV